MSPPSENKYEVLKTQLIERLSASRGERLKQLLMSEELGDRKPSQFLRHIRSLAGAGYPDEFLRTLWSSRLPNLLQSIIAMQESLPLDQVALLADKVHEASPAHNTQVAAASSSFALTQVNRKLDDLAARFEALEAVSGHRTTERHPSRPRGRGCGAHKSRSRSRADGQVLCWYHEKFGAKAAKCKSPCHFLK